MIKLVFSEVMEALHAEPGPVPAGSIGSVSTDSRNLPEGCLFFALRGERFDGHDFAEQALAGNALGVVVERSRRELVQHLRTRFPQGGVAAVDDVEQALGRLANYHRRQCSAEVIAVVGSNGKTTTKSMIDHVLGGHLQGKASPKSFNNQIGVPLTLLLPEAGDDYLVVEIGTNAPGEIAALAALAEPDLAVLTSLGAEHLEGLGDLAGVAREELSIVEHLRGRGFLAVNYDAQPVRVWEPPPRLTLARFGLHDEADLRITGRRFSPPWLEFELNDRFPYRLRTPGLHNALNATAAVAVALRFRLSHEQVAERLACFVGPPMRLEVIQAGPVTVLNDAYNANPPSALAAIEALEGYPCTGRRIAVFGEMRELGPDSARWHAEVAARVASAAIQEVILVGRTGEWMAEAIADPQSLLSPRVRTCPDPAACAACLEELIEPGDVVLLKASRAIGLESVVAPLRQRFAETAAG